MDIPLYLGLALALLVAVQLAVAIAGSLRRQWREEAMFRLKRQKLAAELVSSLKKEATSASTWEGWRTFRVTKLVRETVDTQSVYLVPEDGRAVPPFLPGQYVTLSLRMPGETRPVVRCYSLSHSPGGDFFRCTVKEVPPPASQPELPFGKASRHINRRLSEGELIDLKAPHGNFTLDVSSQTPVVLVGAGIGVTPLFSMLQAVAASGNNRHILAFLQFRSGEHHPLKTELAALARQHKNIQLVTVYSAPNTGDVTGRDYDLRGRLSLDVIRKCLRGNDYEYFICGPGPFMESMVAGLESWGISTDKIHFEAFGPASMKRAKPRVARPQLCVGGNAADTVDVVTEAALSEVRFDLSGITAAWTLQVESLLELAEHHHIPVESGCRAGNCGTCALPIKSGKVVYSTPPGSPPPAGACLPCICVPDGPLVLQA
ncbi:MAG: 2Fe-2S iron-sulfur cluster binding domain-containing protein [Pirellulaceae bacterium]|nr:2Fe-2S iron-sulfur cluster binding domain-containing protein [Pirellulaceae bacterium]